MQLSLSTLADRCAWLPTTPSRVRDQHDDGYEKLPIAGHQEPSKGKVRAEVVHDKLLAQGFEGCRADDWAGGRHGQACYPAGHGRVYRPWIPEPATRLQFNWG